MTRLILATLLSACTPTPESRTCADLRDVYETRADCEWLMRCHARPGCQIRPSAEDEVRQASRSGCNDVVPFRTFGAAMASTPAVVKAGIRSVGRDDARSECSPKDVLRGSPGNCQARDPGKVTRRRGRAPASAHYQTPTRAPRAGDERSGRADETGAVPGGDERHCYTSTSGSAPGLYPGGRGSSPRCSSVGDRAPGASTSAWWSTGENRVLTSRERPALFPGLAQACRGRTTGPDLPTLAAAKTPLHHPPAACVWEPRNAPLRRDRSRVAQLSHPRSCPLSGFAGISGDFFGARGGVVPARLGWPRFLRID